MAKCSEKTIDCLYDCYITDDPPMCHCVACWIVTVFLVCVALGGIATGVWALVKYI